MFVQCTYSEAERNYEPLTKKTLKPFATYVSLVMKPLLFVYMCENKGADLRAVAMH